MGNIGDSISQPVPTVGEAGTGYATKIVNFLNEVKTRLEAKVPLSSLLVGALDMANNAIQNLQYASLYEAATTPSTPAGSLQRFGGNLWFVTPSGACQITDGATLNAAALGGITGDYGSPNPAELRFVDADKTYYLYDDFGGGEWAHLKARTLIVAAGATSAFAVTLDYGGSASYTITLPSALPASQKLVQMEADGDLVLSNTVTEDIVLSSGRYRHAQQIGRSKGLNDAFGVSGGTLSFAILSNQPYWELSSGAVMHIPIHPEVDGARLDFIELWNDGGSNPTCVLYRVDTAAGDNTTGTLVATTTSSTTPLGQRKTIVTVDSPTVGTTGSGVYYILKVTGIAAAVKYFKVRSVYAIP